MFNLLKKSRLQKASLTVSEQGARLVETESDLVKPREAEQAALEKEMLEAEKVYLEGMSSIRDIIAPASMKIEPSYLELNGQFVRTLFVVVYPRYIAVGWFEPLIDYSATIDIGMHFSPIPSEIVLKQLKNKVGVIEAQ